jgi:hypothetical protein
MAPVLRAALICLPLTLASACAQQPPAPAPTTASNAPSTPPAVRSADGTYRGTSTRFQADQRACPSPGLVVVRVLDGEFSYRWNRDIAVLGTVAPDGSVQGASGDISLRGRVNGDTIEGDVSNPHCAYHFRATERIR